jgi:hypothetical protein
VSVSQREHWNGRPEQIRELFTLTRVTGVRAVCSLWTHPLGWEIRVLVNDTFIRSQVVLDPADLQRIANEWRDAMIREGWRTR